MRTVLQTLEEMFWLWTGNFKFIVPVALLAGVPAMLLAAIEPERSDHDVRLLVLPLAFISLAFSAAQSALILRKLLLVRPLSTDHSGGVWDPVVADAWTIFRAGILISLMALLFLFPIALGMRLTNSAKVIGPFAVVLYSVLVKYALANPLIVAEGMGARKALQRSWEMTKGHFPYVILCYLIVGGVDWSVSWLLKYPAASLQSEMSWLWFLTQFGRRLPDTLWIVLSWCMYLRLRENKVQPRTREQFPVTQSPPTPPSASGTAPRA